MGHKIWPAPGESLNPDGGGRRSTYCNNEIYIYTIYIPLTIGGCSVKGNASVVYRAIKGIEHRRMTDERRKARDFHTQTQCAVGMKATQATLLGQLAKANYYVIDLASQKWICTTRSKRIAAQRAKEYPQSIVVLGKPC